MARQKKSSQSIDERIQEQQRILLSLEEQQKEATLLLQTLQEEKDNQIAQGLLLVFKQSGKDYEEFLKTIKTTTPPREKED